MDSQQLRQRAEVHRTIHANRMIALGGTSEGAAKGWETRKAGGGPAPAEKKEGFFKRTWRKVGEAAERSNARHAEIDRRAHRSRTGSGILDAQIRKSIKQEVKAEDRATRAKGQIPAWATK